jgi:hypothetical protein
MRISILGEMAQEKFFKKTYNGAFPAESVNGYHFHSAKMKRKSAICLQFFIIGVGFLVFVN